MGWNIVKWDNPNNLLMGIPNETDFYFVHSYAFVPENKDEIIATTDYSQNITAIVNKDNIWGTQFHPEKSHFGGFQLLLNFCLENA